MKDEEQTAFLALKAIESISTMLDALQDIADPKGISLVKRYVLHKKIRTMKADLPILKSGLKAFLRSKRKIRIDLPTSLKEDIKE
jgi:hypothetical protein